MNVAYDYIILNYGQLGQQDRNTEGTGGVDHGFISYLSDKVFSSFP